ncbi:hypothetical protein, partial [Patulibacter defluvii]|uniref:hypothetical protein n=1 Tax=Patulibacter defluvii TaxID=3095358 RepID=UPI002A74FC13
TGLYDMQARTYDPSQGRFLQQDRFADPSADLYLAADPFTSSRYAFTAANPATRAEYDGHRTPECAKDPSCAYNGRPRAGNPPAGPNGGGSQGGNPFANGIPQLPRLFGGPVQAPPPPPPANAAQTTGYGYQRSVDEQGRVWTRYPGVSPRWSPLGSFSYEAAWTCAGRGCPAPAPAHGDDLYDSLTAFLNGATGGIVPATGREKHGLANALGVVATVATGAGAIVRHVATKGGRELLEQGAEGGIRGATGSTTTTVAGLSDETAKYAARRRFPYPATADEELGRAFRQIYRWQDRRPGGTAGALRREGVGGAHTTKARERARQLNNILRRRTDLSRYDRAMAERVRDDLQSALRETER